jgi:hypothetical protein
MGKQANACEFHLPDISIARMRGNLVRIAGRRFGEFFVDLIVTMQE